MKKGLTGLLLVAVLILFAGCELQTGGDLIPRHNGESAGFSFSKGDKAGEAVEEATTRPDLLPKHTEKDSDTGVPAKEPDAEAYEKASLSDDGKEDPNEYGSAPGNAYNGGVAVEYLDEQYFVLTRQDENYLVAGKWGYYLDTMKLSRLNYASGKLYGVHKDTDRKYDGVLVAYDVTRKTATVYMNRKPVLLYLVNGILYYTDSASNTLLSFDPASGEERIIVDDKAGDFIIYKDRIIYSNLADNGSLYSIPLSGGNAMKLNDRESAFPIVYRGTIWFSGDDKGTKKIMRMNLDGSEETQMAALEMLTPVLCNEYLCFLNAKDQEKLYMIDLSAKTSKAEVKALDFAEESYELLSKELGGFGTYKLESISGLSTVYGTVIFNTHYVNEKGTTYTDSSRYDPEEAVMSLSTMFEGETSSSFTEYDAENPHMLTFDEGESSSMLLGVAASEGHNYYSGLTYDQAEQADKVALEIAEEILSDSSYTTRIEMVEAAAKAVAKYCGKAEYEADEAGTFTTPYGVFVSKKWSSAGAAKALGKVLDYMGIDWIHRNEGTGEHQYCEILIDGKESFADASVGDAKIGEWSRYYEVRDDQIWKLAQ